MDGPKPDRAEVRQLAPEDARSLAPGAPHYMAYVGPPDEYDVMGATQLRLLCALGLRAHHRVLDYGCGSLRAGRLLIPYLDRSRYFGVEPNRWLVEDAVERELGQDLCRIKQPTFVHDEAPRLSQLGVRFDYLVAQSILSHTGPDLTPDLLAAFASCLSPDGVAIVTFVVGAADNTEPGWIYPGTVAYRSETIAHWISDAGLLGQALPWYHPRQTWHLLTKSASRLVPEEQLHHLRGAVLFDAALAASVEDP